MTIHRNDDKNTSPVLFGHSCLKNQERRRKTGGNAHRTVIPTGKEQQKNGKQGFLTAGSHVMDRLFLYPVNRTGYSREWN